MRSNFYLLALSGSRKGEAFLLPAGRLEVRDSRKTRRYQDSIPSSLLEEDMRGDWTENNSSILVRTRRWDETQETIPIVHDHLRADLLKSLEEESGSSDESPGSRARRSSRLGQNPLYKMRSENDYHRWTQSEVRYLKSLKVGSDVREEVADSSSL